MYLSYSEYVQLNGELTSVDFLKNISRAEAIISKHTKSRVLAMANVPDCVKKCCKELVDAICKNDGTVSSKSQSAGGVSESVTFATDAFEDTCEKIVRDYLLWETDDEGTYLLSRGAE